MSNTAQNFLFLRALLAHLDRIEELLRDEWPVFREKLQQWLDKLEQAEDDDTASLLIDEIYETGCQTSASDLVRALFQQSDKHQYLLFDTAVHSVRIFDPTSGQERDVEWPVPKAVRGPAFDLKDIKAAGQTLTKELYWVGAKEAAISKSEACYFNTLFTEFDSDTAIPPDQPLVKDQPYTLYVDISPERKGLGEDDVAFPDHVLAECWQVQERLPLTVWVASHDVDIESPVQILYLPRQGPSEGIRFTIRPRCSDERAFIQVELFYQGHLLQSKRIEVYIVSTPGIEVPASIRPIQTARTTFTTTSQLDPRHFTQFPERVFTIDVERDVRDNSIDFRFLDRTRSDGELAYYNTPLQPEALTRALSGVRSQLKLAVTGEERDGQRIEGYVRGSDGDETLLNTWLPYLAKAGRYLYRALLPETRGTPPEQDQGERLRAALQPGVIIQVNPVLGVVTIPWALLYERELKSVAGRTHVCDRFINCDPGCTDCPYTQDAYVVCPYAFWGYRYIIEQLPCWMSNELPQFPSLVRKIANSKPLYLNLNVWRDFPLWRDHRSKIEAAGQIQILVAEEIAELETVWEQHSSDLDLVYFYSHGGRDEVLGQPYLELSDGPIDSNFLDASSLNWSHAPLVLLNGCATGDYGPESYVSLIEDFRAAGASGVIGTECPIYEDFAEAYVAKLLPCLFRGERLGQAMLNVRLDFLKEKKNPLGLVYTLYAANEVALAQPVA